MTETVGTVGGSSVGDSARSFRAERNSIAQAAKPSPFSSLGATWNCRKDVPNPFPSLRNQIHRTSCTFERTCGASRMPNLALERQPISFLLTISISLLRNSRLLSRAHCGNFTPSSGAALTVLICTGAINRVQAFEETLGAKKEDKLARPRSLCFRLACFRCLLSPKPNEQRSH